jgi:hypothetical protein
MIALRGQRFVGVSQADETRGERPSSAGRAVRTKRVNHAIKQEDRAFSSNIGKTPGAQVQQSSAPSDRMADFRHRCVNANRIDSRSA